MRTGRHKSLVLALALLLGFTMSVTVLPGMAAETALDRGQAEYKLKRYYSAKQEFINAIREKPGDQKAYIWLGRTLEILKEWEDAKATYRACFSINPFSEHGKVAKQNLLDISARMEASQHRAVDSPDQVVDTGILIQRQSLELQARKIKEARGYENQRRRSGNRRTGYFYSPWDYNALAHQTYGPNNEMSNARFARDGHTLYDSANEAGKARLHGEKQAQSVQDTANALIARLGRKSRSSSPALRALGTNLYVQYYRSVEEEEDIPPGPDPLIELKAKQMKLEDLPPGLRVFKMPEHKLIEQAFQQKAPEKDVKAPAAKKKRNEIDSGFKLNFDPLTGAMPDSDATSHEGPPPEPVKIDSGSAPEPQSDNGVRSY